MLVLQLFLYPLLYPVSCVFLFLMSIWISGVREISYTECFQFTSMEWVHCASHFDRGLVRMAVFVYFLVLLVYFASVLLQLCPLAVPVSLVLPLQSCMSWSVTIYR